MMKPLMSLVAATCALAFALPSLAQTYPQKPIHFVVGFPPGGGNDIIARVVGQKLSERLGQPVVVDNKPGANGIIATEFVAKAAPDGYTILIGPSGAMAINPAVYDKLPYDPVKDFAPITMMSTFPLIMAVHPAVPANTLKEFVDYAKKQPGKLNYASGSTPFQLAAELFKLTAKIDIAHIPYKGSAASLVAAVAGDTQFVVVDLPPAVQQVKAGKLKALAVTGPARVPDLPDLPTVAEAGMPEVQVVLFNGLFAPAGTPRPIIDKLHAEVIEVLKMPDVKSRLAELGFDTLGNKPEEASARLKADIETWGRVAREAKVKAE